MKSRFQELESLSSNAEGNILFTCTKKDPTGSSFEMVCSLTDISNPSFGSKEWTINGQSSILFENGERVDVNNLRDCLDVIEKAVRGAIK